MLYLKDVLPLLDYHLKKCEEACDVGIQPRDNLGAMWTNNPLDAVCYSDMAIEIWEV